MTNSAIILNSISLEKVQCHLQRFFVHISTSFCLVSVFCQVSCLIAVVCYHSLTLSRSFSRLLAHSLTLLTHLLTCSLARILSRSLIRSHYSLLYTLSHSAIQLFAHISYSFTHSLYSKNSLTHPRTNTPALTHSLTHSLLFFRALWNVSCQRPLPVFCSRYLLVNPSTFSAAQALC